MGTDKQIKKHKWTSKAQSIEKDTRPIGLYELVLVAVHMENFQMYSLNVRGHFNCSPSFSHDKHHKTDAAKRKGGGQVVW